MKINKVSYIASGNFGSIFVCIVRREQQDKEMLLWEIEKRSLARALLRCEGKQLWDMHFMKGETDCFLLAFRERRPLLRFAGCTGTVGLPEKLTEACMVWEYPWPLLKLILQNREINICPDQTLYFTYILNLDEFDPEADETACVQECAELLREIWKPDMKEEAMALELIEKRAGRGSLHTFIELYQELKYRKKPRKKWKPGEKQKDRCFLCLCGLACILLTMFLSKWILGDIPLLRIFTETFREIGTEILG